MDEADENQMNIIRKKSSFLCDGSYRIFYVTKKSPQEHEDEASRVSEEDKPLNQNGLKNLLFDLSAGEQQPTEKKECLAVHENRESTHITVQREKLERNHRRPTLHNLYPQTQASVQRRRHRFLVACATVFIALTIIFTIIVYVIIKTVKYNTEMSRHLRNRPR